MWGDVKMCKGIIHKKKLQWPSKQPNPCSYIGSFLSISEQILIYGRRFYICNVSIHCPKSCSAWSKTDRKWTLLVGHMLFRPRPKVGSTLPHKAGATLPFVIVSVLISQGTWPRPLVTKRLIVGSRETSKPRDLGLDFCDRSGIWQAPRQLCCRGACQISERYDHINIESRGPATLWDPTI